MEAGVVMSSTSFMGRKRHRSSPPTPLQQAIRRARFRQAVSSGKVWSIVVSIAVLFCLPIYYLAAYGAVDSRIQYAWHTFQRESDTNSSDDGMHELMLSKSILFSPTEPQHRPQSLKTMEAAASSDEATTTYRNPALYGWTPNIYPNPIVNPVRCKIVGIHPPNNTPTWSSPPSTPAIPPPPPPPLRLCDPDWMLGGLYLEDIATQLYNFSNTFGYLPGNEWDVEVVPNGRQRWLGNGGKKGPRPLPHVDLAVATVRKMNLPAVLNEGAYYTYEDEDDMVNDAAQIFARTLHDNWWSTSLQPSVDGQNTGTPQIPGILDAEAASHGILIFLSVQDRVCFISTGAAISTILPWWRLDHIVSSMKPDLHRRDYGNALLQAMQDLSNMLEAGPPTFQDRLHDFFARFGVVIAFAVFTFVFGAWGEYRDRRKRWQFAEQRSRLNSMEREKAWQLQRDYRNKCCPICLENFRAKRDDELSLASDKTPVECNGVASTTITNTIGDDGEAKNESALSPTPSCMDYEMPVLGADGKKIKILRCGHIFCETCWRSWVHSGCGNPCNCPLCRQDIGKSPRRSLSGYVESRYHTNMPFLTVAETTPLL